MKGGSVLSLFQNEIQLTQEQSESVSGQTFITRTQCLSKIMSSHYDQWNPKIMVQFTYRVSLLLYGNYNLHVLSSVVMDDVDGNKVKIETGKQNGQLFQFFELCPVHNRQKFTMGRFLSLLKFVLLISI